MVTKLSFLSFLTTFLNDLFLTLRMTYKTRLITRKEVHYPSHDGFHSRSHKLGMADMELGSEIVVEAYLGLQTQPLSTRT